MQKDEIIKHSKHVLDTIFSSFKIFLQVFLSRWFLSAKVFLIDFRDDSCLFALSFEADGKSQFFLCVKSCDSFLYQIFSRKPNFLSSDFNFFMLIF